LNPSGFSPTPWFGMNHIWGQWDVFTQTADGYEFDTSSYGKTRIDEAEAINMNIDRFDINVMDNNIVKKMSGSSCDPLYQRYQYSYPSDSDWPQFAGTYCAKTEIVLKLTAIARYSKLNNFWLLPVLKSGGEPGKDLNDFYDYTWTGPQWNEERFQGFLHDYWARSATIVYAIADALLSEQRDPNSYNRIIAYEIENEMNHALYVVPGQPTTLIGGHHPDWDNAQGVFSDEAVQLLAGGSKWVRNSENQAINTFNSGSNTLVSPRPIAINYNLDINIHNNYRLTGSITKDATDSMITDVKKVIAEPDSHIDIIGLDYYPDDWNDQGWSPTPYSDIQIAIDELSKAFPTKKIAIFETGLSEYSGSYQPNQNNVQDFYNHVIKLLNDYYWKKNRNYNFLGILFYHWIDTEDSSDHSKESNFGIIDKDHSHKQVYNYLRYTFDWYKLDTKP
jgi:hypothetical protein